jgi:type IV pilus assembly protein PilB
MLISLTEVPLFAGLTAEQCGELQARMATLEFPPMAQIMREGARGHNALLILAGRVSVRRRDPETGLEFELAQFGAGQMIGEMALLADRPRSATVVALEQTTCASLDRDAFEDALQMHPHIALSLAGALAERLQLANERAGIDYVTLSRVKVDERVLALLPQKLVLQHKVLPLSFANGRLTLAMTNPENVVAYDEIRKLVSGVMIEPVAISEDDYNRFLNTAYKDAVAKQEPAKPAPEIDLQSDLIRELQMAEDAIEAPAAEAKQDLMKASKDAPIIRLVNSVLGLAIKQGASDIHIEPMEQDVSVRYRIDGVLQPVQRLPKKVQLGLISRLKILSKLDIAERRLPQDGRFGVSMNGKPIDFRVSTVPGKWGEKVVLRILDKGNTQLGLDQLITYKPSLMLLRELITEPHGIVYVTGPTGSGKTTTLYSALAEINDAGVNISTAEDPIEYDLAGITQIQVNNVIGLTFASVLRAFLRQDPDVMLVGETRDKETAQTAVEAALTGHLVFTTLHTNSAAAAFARLGEMDVEPFLVASSTLGVIAQRLARKLCQKCREPYDADEATRAFLDLKPGARLYRGRGCAACGGKGVKGRIGIYEVMRVTPPIRKLIAARAATEAIHDAAVAEGMLDLKGYAAMLLTEGLTTVEEVTSVVSVRD